MAAPREPTVEMRESRAPSGPITSAIFISGGPISPGDIPELCARARALLCGSKDLHIACDVGELVRPDAAAVDALARLQLFACREGRRITIRRACGELRCLVDLMGLSDVLPVET